MADDQILARRQKRDALRAAGRNPYPERWERTHTLAEAKPLADGPETVSLAGRVMLLRRVSKKMIFLTLQDRSGRLQVSLRLPTLPETELRLLDDVLDLGDFLGVRGVMWTTKTGEKTLDATEGVILAKALRPLPAKWEGVADTEISYRQRYLDLLTNDATRDRFRLRTKITRSIRNYLDAHGFEEVETPILCAKASGALAKPFMTHHNALDLDVTLRIAPETYLKRLVVGGYEKVYEFARCFRNEGMDPSHLQDFTMLEYYVAYWNFEDNMRFTQALIQHAVMECAGTLKFTRPGYQGAGTVEIDLGGEWPRLRIVDLIREKTGIDVRETRDPAALRDWIRANGHADDDINKMAYASLVDHIYKKTVRPGLVQPCFVIGHPIELSPLARRNDADPGLTDRFQLLVNGWEVVNAYSELVDPDDQRGRFEEQARAKAAGDEDAMESEEDYLVCMEHGMPPTSGWGMGIDRLVALLSGQENLRDAVLFPLMKPQ
jgi:lysyl-tRNA synthetase class 2